MRMICLDLISDALPFGRLWNGEPDTVNNAIAPAAVFSSTVLLKSSTILKPVGVRAAVRRFYWENLATSWRRKPIIISANMRKTVLLAGCALLVSTTVIANDFAADSPNFREPQQDLIANVSEILRETKELQSCSQQQQEALQRFLNMGISYNAAALMAHSQYPCDSTDQ
jgi:hypothetical protein